MTQLETKNWAALRGNIVLWEDNSIIVVNKPPGLSVMGDRNATDLITIASRGGEKLWWVNRIDKVTSGAVVLAKSQEAHSALTRQFAKRNVEKAYLAICQPGGLPRSGHIDLPLLSAGNGRVRVAAERKHIEYNSIVKSWHVQPHNLLTRQNYPSVTNFMCLLDDGQNAAILALPITGRRHQIRVHLAWINHAIVGDPLFGKKADKPTPRTYLHSLRIAFEAPSTARWVEVDAPVSDDFWEPIMRPQDPKLEIIMEDARSILNNQKPMS